MSSVESNSVDGGRTGTSSVFRRIHSYSKYCLSEKVDVEKRQLFLAQAAFRISKLSLLQLG